MNLAEELRAPGEAMRRTTSQTTREQRQTDVFFTRGKQLRRGVSLYGYHTTSRRAWPTRQNSALERQQDECLQKEHVPTGVVQLRKVRGTMRGEASPVSAS